jgi:hypothetical protein
VLIGRNVRSSDVIKCLYEAMQKVQSREQDWVIESEATGLLWSSLIRQLMQGFRKCN